MRIILSFLLGCVTCFLHAQLDLKSLMQGRNFIGHSPQDVHWSADGQKLYFALAQDSSSLVNWYEVQAENLDNPSVLGPEMRASKELEKHQTYKYLGNSYIYEQKGQIFWSAEPGHQRQILNWIWPIEELQWQALGTGFLFKSKQSYFYYELRAGSLSQVCEFFPSNEPENAPEIDKEELFLFKQHQREQVRSNEAKSLESKDEEIKKIYLNGEHLVFSRLDPYGQNIYFATRKGGQGTQQTKVPNYLGRDGQVELLLSRPKTGNPQAEYHLHRYNLQTGETEILHFDSLPFLRDSLPFGCARKPHKSNLYFCPPTFNKEARPLLEIRSMDNKDRWIVALNPTQLIDHQRDSAWIAGPGIAWWLGGPSTLGWLDDDQSVYFQSEKTGFSLPYLWKNGSSKALLTGNFEVEDFQLGPKGRHFYFLGSQTGLGTRQVYRLDTAGQNLEQLSQIDWAQGYDFLLSPKEEYLALLPSNATRPPELALLPLDKGMEAEVLTDVRKPFFKNYKWQEPQFISVPAKDGQDIPARLYLPKKGKPKRALIFVHGAGYLQNAHRWWSRYEHEFLFHQFLCEQGYAVLDLDYRGSAGYGRNWRTGIYRHMGGLDLQDQIAGSEFLQKTYKLPVNKIGIYGGSYGGFISLMAMFNADEHFAAGAALRAVTDWRHYNQSYTSNILNSPEKDPEAYRKSSPIYFAEGLKKPLLILHGLVDRNVHAQDVIRLQQRLIELGKRDWDLVLYPSEGHGFRENWAWEDEYRRIFEFFERHLN